MVERKERLAIFAFESDTIRRFGGLYTAVAKFGHDSTRIRAFNYLTPFILVADARVFA